MKVVYIVPGSGGGFYCENCLRDSILVKALRAQGHDVIMVPMYLPLFSDDDSLPGDTPVFYGAISLYLKQKFPWLRHMPDWLEALLDSKPMLAFAAKKAGSTRATGLEAMTLSMLRGEHGGQARELERLVDWLAHDHQPDIVHLSNALLIGLAGRITEKLHVPVCCSLQDEDTWIEPMPPAWQKQIWNTMAERAEDISAFLAVSDFYAGIMSGHLRVPQKKMHTAYIGIDPSLYSPASVSPDPPVIGYLSRLAEAMGFDILVEAFIRLKGVYGHKTLKLYATGGRTGDDDRFIRQQQKILRQHGLLDDVQFFDEFSGRHRIDFLQKCSIVSVPVPRGEAFGLFITEALACGVPVVQPRAGAFPELVEATGGGVIYEPNDVMNLAAALDKVLRNPQHMREMSLRGRIAVLNKFTVDHTARRILDVYSHCLNMANTA